MNNIVSITVLESDDVVTIDVITTAEVQNISAASQAQVNAGTATGVYVEPATLAARSEVITASGTDTYTATIPSGAFVSGQRFLVKFTNANTGATTLNGTPIKKSVSTELASGDILAGEIKTLSYDGTNLQIVGGGGGGGGTWGSITGTLSSQTDLTTYVLGAKTYTGVQTIPNGMLAINNPAATFKYSFVSSAITGNRSITLPLLTGADTFVFANFIQTLTNKSVKDNSFTIQNSADPTKLAAFSSSGITTGTTITLTIPNASGTIALTSDLTDKWSLSATNQIVVGTPTFITNGMSAGIVWGENTNDLSRLAFWGGYFLDFHAYANNDSNGFSSVVYAESVAKNIGMQASKSNYTIGFNIGGDDGTTLFQASGSSVTKLFSITGYDNYKIDIGSDATGDIVYRNSSGYLARLGVQTDGYVLTLASGLPSWAVPVAWSLASGGTLTSPNIVVGSGTNTLKFQFDALGTTPVNGAGIWLANTTAAAVGLQQISPSLVLEGQGWKTTATAASQSVKFKMDVLPVQGTTSPTGISKLQSSINGGAYTNIFNAYSNGDFELDPTATPRMRVVLTGGTNNFNAGYSIHSAAGGGGTQYWAITPNPSTGEVRNHFGGSGFFWTIYDGALSSAEVFRMAGGGRATFTQRAMSSAWGPAITSIPGAHTSLTAATEFISRDFQGATQTWIDGTVVTQRFNYFRGFTLNKTTTAATFTSVFTVYMEACTAGTGVTITNNYALGTSGKVNMASLPTSSAGLATGDIWNNSGVINIV